MDQTVTISIGGLDTSNVWNTNILSYEIQYSDECSDNFVSLVGLTTPFTATTYTLSSGVAKGSKYKFIYRALNSKGFSSFSSELLALAADVPQAPPKPQLVSVSSSYITLSLSPSDDNGGSVITGYALWINSGSYSSSWRQISTAESSYIVDVVAESLTVGLFYSFKYSANNIVGSSDFSDVLTVPLADVPSKPSSLILTPLSKTSISVEWSASTSTGSPAGDITGYVVYRDNGLAGDYTLIYNGTTIATVRSIISSSLTAGYYYQFYYSAVNYAGLSPSSSISGLYSCTEPSSMAKPTAGTITQTSVDITWVAPSDNGGWPITGYEVYTTNLDMSTFVEVQAATVANIPNLRSLTITELPIGIVGQKLKIQLHALNSAGIFSASDILEVVVAGVPSQPSSPPSEDSSTTSKSTIGVTYLQPDDQGSSILTYDVQIQFNSIQLRIN